MKLSQADGDQGTGQHAGVLGWGFATKDVIGITGKREWGLGHISVNFQILMQENAVNSSKGTLK